MCFKLCQPGCVVLSYKFEVMQVSVHSPLVATSIHKGKVGWAAKHSSCRRFVKSLFLNVNTMVRSTLLFLKNSSGPPGRV